MGKRIFFKNYLSMAVLIIAMLGMAANAGAASANDGFAPNANDDIRAFVVQSDGKILVGGLFTAIGGLSQSYIARLNNDGTVETGFNPGADNTVYAIAIQADGKILVGGAFTSIGGQTRNCIARLNSDGTADTGFNPGANSYVLAISIQPDGRILVGGEFTTIGGQTRNYIARLNTDGSVDTGFNPGANNFVYPIAIQVDGKILVGGEFTTIGGQTRNYIARLNSDGSVDTGFNPGADNYVLSIAVQADNAILVGGLFTTIGGQTRNYISRLNSDGSVDTGFNPGTNGYVQAISILPEGKIVVGGYFTTIGSESRNYIARLNRNGSVDLDFNPGAGSFVFSISVQPDGKILVGGRFTTIGGQTRNHIARLNRDGSAEVDLNPGADYLLYAIAVQPDGKILAGGSFHAMGGLTRDHLARLKEDGSVETGFNPGPNSYVLCIAIQLNGDILMGGNFFSVGGQTRNHIARLNNNGVVDTVFNPDANGDVFSIALQADGKTLMGGDFTTVGGQTRNHIARVNEDGSVDTGFNPGANDRLFPIAVQTDGKILVGGNFTTIGGQSRNYIARLNSDGTVDISFNPGADNAVYAIAIQVDGKILVGGGFTHIGGQARNYIARLNTDGSVDTGFNPSANLYVTSIAPQADGKILVGGGFTTVGGQTRNHIARLNSDGSLDTGFNPGSNGTFTCVAVQSDGKILVGGDFTTIAGQTRNYIARLSADDAALQNLEVSADGTTITWSRGQSSPEIHDVTFEYSSDASSWTSLGYGTRISGGWRLSGQSLPFGVTGYIRGSGQTAGGSYSASTSLMESIRLFFNPLPSFTVISPNGGESWTGGDLHNITWSSVGSIANVNIYLSIDNGGSWNPVAASTTNDGTYSWTVPAVSSTTCLVRISDAIDDDPSDDSNAVFTIVAPAETISMPSTPTGPSSGLNSTSYSFSSGGSTSSLGHSVQYKIDWDDGTDSGWLAVGTTQASHSWATNGTYNIRAMARCATHTNLESLWSDSHPILISDTGSAGYYNSPAGRVILPEVNWALASGGGTWMVEAQVIDISGGSQVSVYYNHAGGRRGPFLLWTGTAPGSSIRYDNLLDAIDQVDGGTFTYYGTVGAVEFVTQDATHLIQVSMRQYNGNYSKTHPGLADVAATTADTTRQMVIPNLASNATYRTFVGCFNPSADSVTVEFRLADGSGAMIGTTVTRTIAGYGYDAFNVFTEAGMPYPGNSYTNAACYVHATSGSGRVMCFGATANNSTNDPAAHVAVQTTAGYENSPADRVILPEVNWALASGGGTWMVEAQVIDISGGSQVSVYYNHAGGRRGPFLLWTGTAPGSSVRFDCLLDAIDQVDSGAFTYYGTVGAVEFVTQDGSHLIQVSMRQYNGNYSKTHPGLADVEATTADTTRQMVIPNLASNATYRTFVGCFNPSADSVTVEFRLADGSGAMIGTTVTRTIAGYGYDAFNVFTEAGVPYPGSSYSNAACYVHATSGSGRVMCFGATANNSTNDPAAHMALQAQ